MMKTVLVTGCSTGLGRMTAERFAADGWNVVATMRTPDQSLFEAFQETILVAPLDVTDRASVASAVQAGVDRFGGLDAVVNNAGVSIVSVFETMPMDAISRVFDTNVFGVMNVMQATIPHLAARNGAIVNVTSGVGLVAVPLLSVYVASKHAVEGLSESLTYELEAQNVRIKLVEPGAMRATRFAANTMAASAPPPERYKPYFDHAIGAMMNYPFASTEEAAVIEAIVLAAEDTTSRLRFPVGPDVEEYARLRWSTSEDNYLSEMSRLVGQDAWRRTTLL